MKRCFVMRIKFSKRGKFYRIREHFITHQTNFRFLFNNIQSRSKSKTYTGNIFSTVTRKHSI